MKSLAKNLEGLRICYIVINSLAIAATVGDFIYRIYDYEQRDTRLQAVITEDETFSALRSNELLSCDFGILMLSFAFSIPTFLLAILSIIGAVVLYEKRRIMVVVNGFHGLLFAIIWLTWMVYATDNTRLEDETLRSMRRIFVDNYNLSEVETPGTFAAYWDRFQREYRCCGVYFFRDFQLVADADVADGVLTLPDSCCAATSECTSERLTEILNSCDIPIMSLFDYRSTYLVTLCMDAAIQFISLIFGVLVLHLYRRTIDAEGSSKQLFKQMKVARSKDVDPDKLGNVGDDEMDELDVATL